MFFDSLAAKQGAIAMLVDDTHELYMENCLVTGCLAYGGSAFSGMINKEHGGKVTIKNCTFMNNESDPRDHRDTAVDKGASRGGVIRVQDGEGESLTFIMENTAFINNHPLPVAYDSTYPAVHINVNNVAAIAELTNNIFIGNRRDGYPNDVDMMIPSNDLVSFTNSGNIMNRLVVKSDSYIADTLLDGCKIDTAYTYTHADINFTMDGDLPKLTPDASGIGHVEYTGDGGTPGGGDPGTTVKSLYTISVNVYPNPSKDRFEIHMPENIKRANYEVYNMAGNLVKTGYFNSNTSYLDMSDAAKGVYILKIDSGKKLGLKRLVVK